MIPGPHALARLGALIVLGVVLHISGFSRLGVLDGHPDLVALLVAAVAFFAGSVPGAVTGFLAGLLLDLALGINLGVSSLVLTLVGYAVGRFRELRDPSHGLVPIPVALAATAAYAGGFALLSFMIQTEAEVSVLVLREVVSTALLSALIALPVFYLVRRVLRPVLVIDPVERRRGRERVSPSGPIGLRGLEV